MNWLELLIASVLFIIVFTLIINQIKWTKASRTNILTVDTLPPMQTAEEPQALQEETEQIIKDLRSEFDSQIASSYQQTENLREQIINGYLKPSQILKTGALRAGIIN